MINLMLDKLANGHYREVAMAYTGMNAFGKDELLSCILITFRPNRGEQVRRLLEEEICFYERELELMPVVQWLERLEAEPKSYKYCKYCKAETVHFNEKCVHCYVNV